MKCHELDYMHKAKYSEARLLFIEPDNNKRIIETLLTCKIQKNLTGKNIAKTY